MKIAYIPKWVFLQQDRVTLFKCIKKLSFFPPHINEFDPSPLRWAQKHMFTIPALRSLMQKNHDLEASLGCPVRPCLKYANNPPK